MQAQQATELLNLSGSTVQDLGSSAKKPPGRSTRVLSVQFQAPESEELRSLLPQRGVGLHAGAHALQIAAPDNSEHAQWLKALKQASSTPKLARSVLVDNDGLLNGFSGQGASLSEKQAHPLEPTVAVSAFLCSHSTGQDLLHTLSRARLALKEGLLNLGGARDEARKSQFALNSIRRLLRDVDLSITHRQRDPEEEADLGLEDRVRDWLEQSLSEFSDVDTNLETLQMKDAPFTYDWEAFAHDTLLKLHKLEEALRLGQYANRRKKQDDSHCSENGGNQTRQQSVFSARSARAVMPYSHYKLKQSL